MNMAIGTVIFLVLLILKVLKLIMISWWIVFLPLVAFPILGILFVGGMSLLLLWANSD